MNNKDFPEIPDELWVAAKKREKKVPMPKVKYQAGAAKQVSPEDAALAALEPEMRSRIEEGIRSKQFQRHWVLDFGQVREFIKLQDENKLKRAAGLERLASLPRPKKAPKPTFGAGVKIVAILKENARGSGETKAVQKFAAMTAWWKEHGKEKDVAALCAETIYKKEDFKWDYSRKVFQTNPAVLSIPDAKVREPRQAKAATPKKAKTQINLPPAGGDATWSGKVKPSNKRTAKVLNESGIFAPLEVRPVDKKTQRKAGNAAVKAFVKAKKKVTKAKKK